MLMSEAPEPGVAAMPRRTGVRPGVRPERSTMLWRREGNGGWVGEGRGWVGERKVGTGVVC